MRKNCGSGKSPLKKSILIPLIFLALIQLVAGCSDEPATPVTATEKPATTQTYGTDPLSTGLLLRDASQKLQELSSQGKGVHFTLSAAGSAGAATITSRAEGDMVFPDRLKMKLTDFSSGQPVEVEIVMVDGRVYSRVTATGAWLSSSQGYLAPDPQSIKSFMDFARSSRNFGGETLRGGRKTIHVQVDVDTALAAEEAKKHTDDPALQRAIESTRDSTITVDMWIGAEDLLLYQQKVVISNPVSSVTTETTYQFSEWGKTLEITRPCDAC